MTLHAKQPDSASLYLAQAAMNDAWAGNRNEARGRLKRLCSFHRDAKEKPSQPWPWRLQATRPRPCAWPTTSPIAFRKTPWCRSYVPMIRAAAALHSGAPMNNPDAILNELAPAMPTEFGSHAVDRVAFLTCYSIYFRGEAYLDARQGIQAAAEFQKILDHPQLTLTDPVSAWLRLGLHAPMSFPAIAPKVLPLIKTSRIFGKMPTRPLALSTSKDATVRIRNSPRQPSLWRTCQEPRTPRISAMREYS